MPGEVTLQSDGSYAVHRVELQGEPRLVSFSRAFLIVVNILTFLGGLVLTGAGIYVYIEYTNFSVILSQNDATGIIVAGLLTAFIAGVGSYGVVNDHLITLGVYAFVSFVLFLAILSILGLLVEYVDTVAQVAAGTLTVFNDQQVQVNDFFASAYTACCVQNPTFCPSLYANETGYCPPVTFCGKGTSGSICYAGTYGVNATNPPVHIVSEICGSLLSVGVVGPANSATGACGYPNGASGFFKSAFSFILGNITYPYISIGLLSGIIFFELVFCFILARFIHRVHLGEIDTKATKSIMSSPSPRSQRVLEGSQRSQHGSQRSQKPFASGSGVITLADQFLPRQDEFDSSLRNGISMDGSTRASHKSGTWQASNPIFRNLFNTTKKNTNQSSDQQDQYV